MSMTFDMTRPEEMARLVRADLRASGKAYAETRAKADDAKDAAKKEPKLVSIAVRKGKIDIGEKATEQAVKDFVATCPQVERLEMIASAAEHEARVAEVAWECAKSDRDLLKGLLYHSGRMDG